MPDPRTDQIAREAARLIETGRIDDIHAAIHRAADGLGMGGVALPGVGRVRRHAQAMAMQSLGDAEYQRRRRRMRETAEQMMTALEHAAPESQTLLAGRAAQGHIDAGVTIHVRMYSRSPLHKIVQCLLEFGYGEPSFATSRPALAADDDFDVVLTRCPPEMMASAGEDLVTGRPIVTLDLMALRRIVEQEST